MATTTTTPPAAPPATYRSVFAVREFRIVFFASLMYGLGTQFEILGMSVLVYAQTRSAFLAAFAFSIGFSPQLVGGALFTSLADRLPPRVVYTTCMLARAAPGLLIGALPGMPVAVMLVMVAAAAMIMPVYSAAVSGILADVLKGDQYVLGRSSISVLNSSSQIIGMGIGGAILVLLPARGLLLAAGSALVLSALVRRGLPPRPARQVGPLSLRGTVRGTMAGNARLFRDHQVRKLLLAQWLPLSFTTGAESLVVPYVGSLGKAAAAAGPLLAATPAGMILGEYVVGRWCRPAFRQRMALPLAVLTCLPWLLFAIRPPLVLAACAMFCCGCGTAYELGLQRLFLDSVPGELRGQAFGLNATGVMGGQGVGPWLTGALAAVVGPAVAIAASGGAGVVSALALIRKLNGRTGDNRAQDAAAEAG